MTSTRLAQNKGKTASSAHRGRGRPFRKGRSGNPGGRPKGFAAYIRERTGDGTELVEFALSIMRNRRASLQLRLAAASWLADRGFGKPTQSLEYTGSIEHSNNGGDGILEKVPLNTLQEIMRKLDAAHAKHGGPLMDPV